jgi:hypothetical protein
VEGQLAEEDLIMNVVDHHNPGGGAEQRSEKGNAIRAIEDYVEATPQLVGITDGCAKIHTKDATTPNDINALKVLLGRLAFVTTANPGHPVPLTHPATGNFVQKDFGTTCPRMCEITPVKD